MRQLVLALVGSFCLLVNLHAFDDYSSNCHHERPKLVIKGPTGPQGPTGAAGATGAKGAAGADGGRGPAGTRGPIGAKGAQGLTGATGPTGPAGGGTSTPAYASAYKSIPQTIENFEPVTLDMDNVRPVNIRHETDDVFTVNEAGIYSISYTLNTNAPGNFPNINTVTLNIAGNPIASSPIQRFPLSDFLGASISAEIILELTAGQTVQLILTNGNTTAFSVINSTFNITRIAPAP
jgi:hypothetical protein